jgi:large subunit ribosomal protein L6
MSRIGRLPIVIPSGVTVTVAGSKVTVKGKLGELTRTFHPGIGFKVEDGKVLVSRADDSRMQKSCHGLSRTLVHNMITGVSEGYKKALNIEGTGFKAVLSGKVLNLSLGFANPKAFPIPQGITITVDPAGLNVGIAGADKELVGDVAARIRGYYPAEPYKGKGIKYVGEKIRRKQGKTVA